MFSHVVVGSNDLAKSGLQAELVGLRMIQISRNGSHLGVWRQAFGCYDWYPAGYNQPQHRVPTTVEAVNHLVRTLCRGR